MIVEVAYIDLDIQFVKKVDVVEGVSIETVIKTSGLLEEKTDISLDKNQVGIFGEIATLDVIVKENDRVEIYRALKMDPMDARRLRAKV
ncbi:UNVERIFIED_CONTAM: hypothetical protein GTU68_053462 [Idotea baltica]|nr:hypothetical protein [Idotea baltica]